MKAVKNKDCGLNILEQTYAFDAKLTLHHLTSIVASYQRKLDILELSTDKTKKFVKIFL